MPLSLLSVRLLPIEVITKQLDCCTARRISGSMVVTWVSRPKEAYHSLPRPSSTASVPSGSLQRSRLLLALTLDAPAAAPVAIPPFREAVMTTSSAPSRPREITPRMLTRETAARPQPINTAIAAMWHSSADSVLRSSVESASRKK